jgi:hypothetical protein
MRWLRAVCFRCWPAMLAVAVLMYALQFVGWAEAKRSVKGWIREGM